LEYKNKHSYFEFVTFRVQFSAKVLISSSKRMTGRYFILQHNSFYHASSNSISLFDPVLAV